MEASSSACCFGVRSGEGTQLIAAEDRKDTLMTQYNVTLNRLGFFSSKGEIYYRRKNLAGPGKVVSPIELLGVDDIE